MHSDTHMHRCQLYNYLLFASIQSNRSKVFQLIRANFIVIHSTTGTGTHDVCCKCIANSLLTCFSFFLPFFTSSFQSVCIELCKLNCKCILLTLTHTHTHTHTHSFSDCLHSWHLKCKQTPPLQRTATTIHTRSYILILIYTHTLMHPHTHARTHTPRLQLFLPHCVASFCVYT